MIKAIGILAVFFSCVIMGIIKSITISSRVKFFEDYLEFISQVKTQIKYTYKSIDEIITNLNCSKEICDIVAICMRKMENGKKLYHAWSEAANEVLGGFLSKNDICLISEFSNGLGQSDVEGQQVHCLLNEENVKSRLFAIREESLKKGKVYTSIGILCGASIAIVLL